MIGYPHGDCFGKLNLAFFNQAVKILYGMENFKFRTERRVKTIKGMIAISARGYHRLNTRCFPCLGGILGKFVGNPKDSTEKLKLPAWMGFFRDVTASVGFLISVLMIILAIIVLAQGKAGTTTVGQGATYIVAALQVGLNFAMGITVLLFGVRMLIAEIVPAFRGFAMKIVPDAKPALDCPVVFDYAPLAVVVGFISATVAFFLLMILFGPVLKWTTIVPPFIMLFFPGGAGGVFGNATGGFKGAVLGGAICGILLAVGQAIVTPMLSTTAPELAQLADPDWYILVLIFKPLFSLILPH